MRILSAIDEVLKSAATHDHLLVLDASGAGLRVEDGGYKSVGLVVGPEGGLAKQEFEQLQSLPNASTVKLSPFTLRSETAAIAGLAVLGN